MPWWCRAPNETRLAERKGIESSLVEIVCCVQRTRAGKSEKLSLNRFRDGVRGLRPRLDQLCAQIGENVPIPGTLLATYQQYAVYVSEGVLKNCYTNQRHKRLANGRRERLEERLVAIVEREGEGFLYIANLYGNIEDTFNRPIYSPRKISSMWPFENQTIGEGTLRVSQHTGICKRCLNLGSHNYLGFGGVNSFCTPRVKEVAMENPVTSGSCAAELGRTKLLMDVEEYTARYVGKEAAMVDRDGICDKQHRFTRTGQQRRFDYLDKLNHNSIVEGARLSGAKIIPFEHNCAGSLELILQEATNGAYKYGKIVVVVEGIYSMEGELCNLKEIVEVCKYNAHVYLDEAHSIGAIGKTGRGVTEELGVDPKDISIMMGTYTKSFGAAGDTLPVIRV